ncbi:glycosyltransferase family 2 protein [Flavisolibacter ginsenosidimutans]|uniref:Glycosyltransferase n=1 Tax=Flavisolibacter ginsenosidimutans TaxID=661481 RepID=A0A5B8UFE8_9BACT|nr:glycosyltransferase family 2 protein [Flavisolibacter ginsenosidimutans]QEC54859.1 glycosyltransferase [Flavisolibacter ginsenosidimutans]
MTRSSAFPGNSFLQEVPYKKLTALHGNHSPQISVIIPTRNSAATVAHALDSLLCQSFTDFEVLVIDGQSTDETIEILKQYAHSDKRIQWWSEFDEGIYDAINKGITKAGGEWLYFLGSDDTLHEKDVFEGVMRIAVSQPGAKMIYGNVLLSASIGFDYESLVFAGEFHSSRLLTANICQQAIFYHRSLFASFGKFNTNYKLLADWDFNLRCFNRISSFYTDRIIANFSAGASSAQYKDKAFQKDWIQNLVFIYPYSPKHRYFRKWKGALLTLFLRELLSLHIIRAIRVSKVLFYQLNTPALHT